MRADERQSADRRKGFKYRIDPFVAVVADVEDPGAVAEHEQAGQADASLQRWILMVDQVVLEQQRDEWQRVHDVIYVDWNDAVQRFRIDELAIDEIQRPEYHGNKLK